MYMYMYNEYRSYKYIFYMTLGVKQHIGRGRVSRRTENKGLINNQEFIWQNAGIKTVQYWSKYDNSWNHMLTILGKELVKSYIERRKNTFLKFTIWENLAGLKNQSLYTPLPWNFCKIKVIIFIGRVARVSNFN